MIIMMILIIIRPNQGHRHRPDELPAERDPYIYIYIYVSSIYVCI